MSGYTPGPWRTFNGTDVFPDDGDREGQSHIADCAMFGWIDTETQNANARLIAAAPDLLEALEEVKAWSDKANPAGFALLPRRLEMLVEASIAKATVTQPTTSQAILLGILPGAKGSRQ